MFDRESTESEIVSTIYSNKWKKKYIIGLHKKKLIDFSSYFLNRTIMFLIEDIVK